MKYMKLMLIAMSLVFFASCAEDSESPTGSKSLGVEVGKYSPANEGSYWKYEVVQNGAKSEITSTVTGTTEKIGQTWVEYESIVSGQTQVGYLRYDNGKYYALIPEGSSSIVGDFEYLAIDENAEIGDKWEIPADVRVQGTNQIITSYYKLEVHDKLSSYEVRGKTYNDIIVMSLNLSVVYSGIELSRVNQLNYYAAGVGTIKSEAIGTNVSFIQELVEYKE